MGARSLNKASLIGNLTRDPELRYTPQGTAVCTFGVATNRSWTTDTGEKREETEFHRIVSWNKLAELCSQLLTKGRKVYLEGRLSTRTFTGSDGNQRTITEIVIEDMILLDSRRPLEAVTAEGATPEAAVPETPVTVEEAPSADLEVPQAAPADDDSKKKKKKASAVTPQESPLEKSEVSPSEDIPF